MMRVEEPAVFSSLKVLALEAPADCIRNEQIAPSAGMATSKMRHRHCLVHNQSGNNVSQTLPIFIAYGATCTVIAIDAGNIAKPGAATTFTVDLLKNGVSVLAGAISLSTANTNRVKVAGVISTPSGVAGDWYEIALTLTGANPGTGFGVRVLIDEDPV